MTRRHTHIIGLVGHARAGKDTVAARLVDCYGYKRFAIADPIRRLTEIVAGDPFRTAGFTPYSWEWTAAWEAAKDEWPAEVRTVLQETGLAALEILGPDVWLLALERHIDSQPDVAKWVVPDIRMLNEARWMDLRNQRHVCRTDMWVVRRPGIGAVNGHAVEAEIGRVDALAVEQGSPVFENSTTIEELIERVDYRMLPMPRGGGVVV